MQNLVEVNINHFDAQTHVWIQYKVNIVYAVVLQFWKQIKMGELQKVWMMMVKINNQNYPTTEVKKNKIDLLTSRPL